MDREALITEMMTKGHERSTAEGAIAGRGIEDLWNEYMGGGGEVSATSLDISQVPSAEKYVKEQFVGEDVAFKDWIDALLKRQAPLDIYTGLEAVEGLPELRGAAKTLTGEVESIEDILRGIEPQVAATTRESMVTEAQRAGIVQARAKPFLKRFSEISTALGRIVGRITKAEAGIATKVQLAMEGQKMTMEPFELQFSLLTDRNARLLTGFTTDRQTQLDLLFDKLERERTLSDADWERANTLADQESGYREKLEYAAAGVGIELTGDESIEELLGLIGKKAAEEGWELTPADIDEGDKEW